MKQKSRKGLIIALVVAIVILTGLIAWMLWFLNSHFFVSGKAYPNEAQVLNLRGESLDIEEYESIRGALPDCRILWDVPFQNGACPDDATELTISTLSGEDLEMLRYFPALKRVHADGCRDYDQLMQLRERYPHLQVEYTVPVNGQEYGLDTKTLTVSELTDEDIAMLGHLQELKYVDAAACRDYEGLAALRQLHPEVEVSYRVEVLGQTLTEADTAASFQMPDVSALMTELAYAVNLETVHLEEPASEADQLLALTEAYPRIAFTWNKTTLGKTFSSEDPEIDFSGISLTGTDEVEQAMAYFPRAEKVIMSNCGIDNETMAAFRDKMRPEYKVVWTVYVTKKPIRTDSTIIHSSALKVCFIDELSYDLKYCEDAVVVDIGHSYVKYIDWVRYMPNLKYLILTHNWIKDLTPISTCKKLEYLEIYWNEHIPDYTPLLGCTALKDLNLSGTYADPAPLQQMTWLENLWANATDFSAAEKQALVEALPNTRIEFTGGDYTSKGWRQVQGYYDMRDLMGLPYNTW